MNDRTYTEYSADASIVRMTAAIVGVIAFVAVLAHSVWLVAFLSLDYLMRGVGFGAYSLMERCGDELAHIFGLEASMVDPAPDRFSARIGFVLTFAATLLYALDRAPIASAVTALVVFTSAIEAGMAVRVGERVLARLPKRLAALLAR